MAGRKSFVSGEILTASDVNSFLMDQSVMVFDDGAARGSAIPSPSEGMVTYRKDLGGAAGLEVFDGSAFGPVGRILQVVSAVKTDSFTTTSGTPQDVPGLSLSITPSSANSKILVTGKVDISNNSNQASFVFLVRNSTLLEIGDSAGSRTRSYAAATGGGQSTGYLIDSVPLNTLDSPGTTSPVTYKVQLSVRPTGSPTGIAVLNRTGSDADVDSNPRTMSSITLMEVAG